MSRHFNNIIITSDEPYSDTWHTQLIYAEYLSGQSEVLFINPPEKWKPSNLFRFKQKEKKINARLTLIYYKNVFPAAIPCLYAFNEWLNQRWIKKKLQKKNVNSVLIWHFDSFRSVFNAKVFTNNFRIKRIYHVIDPYMKNPRNNLLAFLADEIVVTSPRNNEYYSRYANKLLNTPQAINVKLSKSLLGGPVHRNLPGNFVVLLGTISDDLDMDWLAQCVEMPSVNLVIIGKTINLEKKGSAFNALISKANVMYLGQMPPEKFYPVIARAAAGLILYDHRRKSQVSSPLKIINYLVANIPAISNIDCEIGGLQNECLYMAHDLPAFTSFVSRASNNKLSFNVSLADMYLESVSLENAVGKILSEI